MQPLDELYKRGTSSGLKKAMKTARADAVIEESAVEDGSVHLDVKWGTDELRMDCFPERIHFSYLSTTCHPVPESRESRSETYKGLVAVLVPLFREKGVKRFTATPDDEPSSQELKRLGGFKDSKGSPEGDLTWDITI